MVVEHTHSIHKGISHQMPSIQLNVDNAPWSTEKCMADWEIAKILKLCDKCSKTILSPNFKGYRNEQGGGQ